MNESPLTHPASAAASVIIAVMARGSAKDGCDESCGAKSKTYHLGKAARHMLTAFMMYCGLIPEDGEGWRGHLHNGITRAAMVLAQDAGTGLPAGGKP